jgi:predicted permease
VFAITQIAFSFVLLAGAGMLLATLVSLQTANTGYNMRQVLALDVPSPTLGLLKPQEVDFYQEVTRRIAELPGVQGVALGNFVPWRDVGSFGSPSFTVEGHTPENGEEDPHARFRVVSPGFFAILGVPLVAGRDFTAEDRRGNELVVVVSESVAQRLFPNGSALNRKMWWTDPYFGRLPQPRRIIGVVADVDDENVVRGPAPTIYHPVQQVGVAGRLFVHAAGDPYALVAPVRRIIRDLSANQPVERAATLQAVRAEVLAPERLNAFVFSGFAGIALLIAAVGVAGVLAFSVSARTREFGVRLAVGSTPRHLLVTVLSEGVVIVAIGIVAGAAGAYLFGRLGASHVETLRLPGLLPMLGAAAVLIVAALLASLMPASRASRVDVLQALRSE